MTTEQKNTIIAEAMGLPKIGICQRDGQMYGWKKKNGTTVAYPACKMKFQTSTRWLLMAIMTLTDHEGEEGLRQLKRIATLLASGHHLTVYEAVVRALTTQKK